MAVPEELAFRSMLVDIGQRLSEKDLNALKYLCRDFIPRGRLEDIEVPQDLWDALEERGKLSLDNTIFLRSLLNGGCEGRVDLLSSLTSFEERHRLQSDGLVNRAVMDTNQPSFNQRSNNLEGHAQIYNGLEAEMNYIVKSVGRDWRELARALRISEPEIELLTDSYPRDLRERVRQSLYMWQTNTNGTGSKQDLVSALQRCSRNDLAHGLGQVI